MSIGLSVGSRLPAYCASMGRVLIAARPEKEWRKLLEAAPRPSHTPHTLTRVGDLEAELARVAREGYAIIDQELEVGLRSIAVPVIDAAGRVVAAINVGAQAERVSLETMRAQFLPRLLEAQAELRRLLG